MNFMSEFAGCDDKYSCHTGPGGFCGGTSVGKRSSGVEKKMAVLLSWAFLLLIGVCTWDGITNQRPVSLAEGQECRS